MASSSDSPSNGKASAQTTKVPATVPTQANAPDEAGPKDAVDKTVDEVEKALPGSGATNAPSGAGRDAKDL